MALFEDVLENGLGGGVALAIGAVVLGPVLVPALGRAMRPVIKTAMKGGVVVYGWGRESFAGAREYIEDTYAEAQAEMEGIAGAETGRVQGRSRGRSEDGEEAAAQPG